jgi:hypothetical protein
MLFVRAAITHEIGGESPDPQQTAGVGERLLPASC